MSQGAYTMVDGDRYRRPVHNHSIEVSEEVEGVIARACPGNTVAPWVIEEHHDPFWGPFRRVEVGSSTSPDLRFKSSSGGALSALLIQALKQNQIAAVLHIGANAENPILNSTVWSKTEDEIIARSGSRYVSSSPLEVIDAALNLNERFAVVGKPCDISALRMLALEDDRVNAKIPLMVSFFCAGIPSTMSVRSLLTEMQLDGQDIEKFDFRGDGWPGQTRAITKAGVERSMSYEDSWGNILSKDIQFRCKICPDGVGGSADIVCADAWYGDDRGFPTFAESDGRSLIIARTANGHALLSSAQSAGRIQSSPLATNEITKMQPSQAKRKRLLLARILACRVALRRLPTMEGLSLFSAARRAGFLELVRNFAGTLRRVLGK